MIILENISKVFYIPHERTKTLFHKLISVSKRGYTYEKLFALNGVSLHIKQGEFVGIIGKNGSGKSTLLRIMAGIYKPTAGRVTVNEEISPLLELGLGFDPEFSCRDNIFVYGALLGYSRAEMAGKVSEILAFAELERFADTKLQNLSTGMRMRLAFAIAIQSVATVVLVDEVLAVGDKVFAEKCKDFFRRFKAEKKTIVLVSHDMSAIEEFSDRVLVMEQGELIHQGAAKEMIAIYNEVVLQNRFPEQDRNMRQHVNQQPVHSSSVSTRVSGSTLSSPKSIPTTKTMALTPESSGSRKGDAGTESGVNPAKTNGYVPETFWRTRLQKDFTLKGVGNLVFSLRYNQYLYRQREKALLKILKKHHIDLRGKRVLDVGCGTGYFGEFFADRGANVLGIDIVPEVIEQLRGRNNRIDVELADIRSKSLKLGKKFDIINVLGVLYHIIDEEEFLRTLKNLSALLRPGGYLFMTDRFGDDDNLVAPHVKWRSIQRYAQLESLGLRILGTVPIHHLMDKKHRGLSLPSHDRLAPAFALADTVMNALGAQTSGQLRLLVARRGGAT